MDKTTRRGMTLMELLVATALMTTVMTAVAVLVRSSYSAWQIHEADTQNVEAAHAVVRHLVRQIRQADSVIAVSAKTDTAGTLSVLDESAQTLVWARNGSNNEVRYGISSASDILAEGITELTFTAYQADGTTETTTVGDIQGIKCAAKVLLPSTGGTRTVSSWAWLRSW